MFLPGLARLANRFILSRQLGILRRWVDPRTKLWQLYQCFIGVDILGTNDTYSSTFTQSQISLLLRRCLTQLPFTVKRSDYQATASLLVYLRPRVRLKPVSLKLGSHAVLLHATRWQRVNCTSSRAIWQRPWPFSNDATMTDDIASRKPR